MIVLDVVSTLVLRCTLLAAFQAFGMYAERYRSVQKYIKYSVKALKSLDKCVLS
jgi:hypothetical protein